MHNSIPILFTQAKFHFKQTWSEIPFVIVTISGVGMLITLILLAKGFFGAPILPSTYTILESIGQLEIGLVALAALYTGETYWKDRLINIQHITDSLPQNNNTRLFSQVLGLLMVFMSLMLLLMVTGIIVQISQGFTDLNIKLYLGTIFTKFLLNLFLVIVLSLFVHAIINQKLMANGIIILLLIANSYFPAWGLEHQLYQFGNMRLGPFSDLNGYLAHEIIAFPYYTMYWVGFGIVLFQLASLFSVRGTDTHLITRFRLLSKRFTKSAFIVLSSGTVLCLSGGFIIQHNTTNINEFKSRVDQRAYRVAYEKTLKRFETDQVPEITSVTLNVDLSSSKRAYGIKGTYTLVNPTEKPIYEIFVQSALHPKIKITSTSFDRGFQLKEAFPEFQFSNYQLDEPIAANDTVEMQFTLDYLSEGFSQNEPYSVYQNGAFFTNGHLPKLSYNANQELEGTALRARYGLKAKERLKNIGDSTGYSLGTNYANNISYDATISTDADQKAGTSGYLVDEWKEGNRNYFRYKSESPIENQFVIVSGKYEQVANNVVLDKDTVALSIYHHKKHDHNLSDMMSSMKSTLKYCSEHLNGYQYKTLNLFEIPRYLEFAMSIPNTIAFSEGVGFMMKNNSDDINMPFYVTAHETAHQWWGDQVRGADVKGKAMVTETLAQYVAAVVTMEQLGEGSLRKILDHERERYLAGRKNEKQTEQPLFKAENQQYIHYGKGLVNMMALRHYVSEDSINRALRRVIKRFPAKQGIYPDSKQIISAFRDVTADSLQYLITDLFEKIIFYENRVLHAESTKGESGGYSLSTEISTKKFEADPEGLQHEVSIGDWVELAVYGVDEKLLYRKMHRFTESETTLTVALKGQPSRVVIDPSYLLMDRNLDDNEWKF